MILKIINFCRALFCQRAAEQDDEFINSRLRHPASWLASQRGSSNEDWLRQLQSQRIGKNSGLCKLLQLKVAPLNPAKVLVELAMVPMEGDSPAVRFTEELSRDRLPSSIRRKMLEDFGKEVCFDLLAQPNTNQKDSQ